MINRSIQAVVPVGHGPPEEWQDFDVFSPKIVRFANIGDVVYRHEFSVCLSPNTIGPLERDTNGPYRLLKGGGPIHVNDQDGSSHRLRFEFDGAVGDVVLFIRNQAHEGQQLSSENRVQIRVDLADQATPSLSLRVERPVKLRQLSWRALP
jgi:hypothetical protein